MSSVPVFVGLDYHQDAVQVCVVDGEGRTLFNRSVANELAEIERAATRHRIVITAAKKYRCRAVGVGIDRELVELSRAKARQAGVEDLLRFEQADIFTVDFAEADVVALYLLPQQLEKLVPQLEKLKPGSRIVSHQFEIPGVRPDETLQLESTSDGEKHTIHLWTTPLANFK